MKISSSVFEASKKIFFRILIAIFILTSLFIIACIVTYFFRENPKVVIDSYDTKVISISELEKIVKVKFTDDCIENPKIDLISSGGNGISMGDWVAAPNTFVDISYELSEETLHDRAYYEKTTTDTIKGKLNFDKEIYHIINKYNVNEDQVEYVNVKYGTCPYDITDGVTYVDYYFYIVVVKMADQKYKILITGKYPYPIALN